MSTTLSHLSAALADRYRIERELGSGGMATVYLAHDVKHDRKVAVKVLRPELAAALGHERFLREITTTASLRHPHILPLHDSGDADGFLFYVMPFIDGETLRDRMVREKQLSLGDALRIATEVADALSYAHARGIVHRDIKPENILLEGDHAVVADFGVARAARAAGESSLTQAGLAIGTPAYMSPEQAAGERELDGRSDLYALGCVTYEMLAGQPPFTGPTVESLIHQHMVAEPRPVTQIRSTIPVAVAGTLQRALAKNPADRFPSLGDFSAALRTEASTPTAAPARTNRLRAAWPFAAAAAAIVIAGTLWMRRADDNTALDPDVIAVLPFRVGGPSIDYLRESMLDLMQARLSGGTGARTVEPRTLLAAWRRRVKSEAEDLSEQESRALATELGAGRVLLGSAIATPTELTLNGTLVSVGNGDVLARESVTGPPDSVAALVNRLTAVLLIGSAGETGERRAGLAAAPIEALQDYLAGRKLYRRGDYMAAMDRYRRAFDRDSTFVDAAFSMVATNMWIGTILTLDGYTVIPRVWSMRDRLGARDRELFLAMPAVGPHYPKRSDYTDIISQAERAANAAPDSPDHWLFLGQLLATYGAAASWENWPAREAQALDKAIALDSSFTIAVGARLYGALTARDWPAIDRYAALLESRVTAGFTDDYLLWAVARARGDSASAIEWRNRTTGLQGADYLQKLMRISLFGTMLGVPLSDARWAVATLHREARTDKERISAAFADYAVRFNEGRSGFGDDAPSKSGNASVFIQQALLDPAYRASAATIIEREARGSFRMADSAGAVRWVPLQLCDAQLFRVTAGDSSGTEAAIVGLRKFAALDPPPLARDIWEQVEMRICPLLLEVLREEARSPGAGRWAHLDELDSLMQRGPRGLTPGVGVSPAAFANFTIARLREGQGDLPRALAAIRRRETDGFPMYLWSRPAFLRQEGRLAALAGDTAGARRAYDDYLVIRTNPDAPMRAQRDSVLAERALLGGGAPR